MSMKLNMKKALALQLPSFFKKNKASKLVLYANTMPSLEDISFKLSMIGKARLNGEERIRLDALKLFTHISLTNMLNLSCIYQFVWVYYFPWYNGVSIIAANLRCHCKQFLLY